MAQNETQMTPQQHAQQIESMLQQAQQECRADVGRINDPRAQALFETIAEVLGGAMKALHDYQSGNERAWQSSQQSSQQSAPTRTQQQRTQPPTVSDMAVDVDAAEPPPRLYTEIPREWREHE